MAERTVRVAEDDVEMPEISGVKVLSKKTESVNTDVFARPAEDLREYRGHGQTFKRRTAPAQLEKFRRANGVESKQIDEKGPDFLTGYDTYEVIEPPYNLEYLTKLYELSAPHYAAVNAKVSNIVGLGYKFQETSKTKRAMEQVTDEEKLKKARRKLDQHRAELHELIESFNEEDTFLEVMIKVWRDYEVTGNGYLEIGRKKDGTIGYVGHIPSQTMRIRRKRDGFVQITGFAVQFFAHFGEGIDDNGNPQRAANPIGGGQPNEVIHLKKYSPTSGYYGIPDIVAAKQAIAGNEFAARYNLDYFENKAVPRYAIILKGATLGQHAEESLLSFFETGLKGQNHRSIYIPLPADTAESKVELKLEAIETGVQDSSFINYTKANRMDILMVHRVPESKISISGGASLAVAKDADKTFKEQVCAPEQKIAEKKFNRIFKEFTDAFELKLNELTLTDENTQSQIDERRRKTGVETANEQRVRRGEPTIEGGDELFDMNAATKLAEMADETTRRGQDKAEAAAKEKAKAVPAAGANASGNPAGTRQRDTTRSANATDSAGAARNPKGEGRTTP